jgi:hypothetical protein
MSHKYWHACMHVSMYKLTLMYLTIYTNVITGSQTHLCRTTTRQRLWTFASSTSMTTTVLTPGRARSMHVCMYAWHILTLLACAAVNNDMCSMHACMHGFLH